MSSSNVIRIAPNNPVFDLPVIVGIEEDIFSDMGLKCFSGNGSLPLPALTLGAVGTVDAPLSISPWHYVSLYNFGDKHQMRK